MTNSNNTLLIVVIVLLALLLFGGFGYGMMGFDGGRMGNWDYGFGWIFAVIAIICAVWVIYDVIVNNRGLSDGMKLLWVVCAVLFSIVTAIIYYLIGRNNNNDLFRRRR